MDINIKGLSTFFYFAIPLVLAVAAVWWLMFADGLHIFLRTVSQEKRHAEIVGATTLPKAPIKIVIDDYRDAPIVVARAEIDGSDLWIYYKNVGQSTVSGIEYNWRLIAPDGTVIKAQSSYISVYARNAPDSLNPGERGEAKLSIPSDPRAVTLQVGMHR